MREPPLPRKRDSGCPLFPSFLLSLRLIPASKRELGNSSPMHLQGGTREILGQDGSERGIRQEILPWESGKDLEWDSQKN